MKEKIKPSTSTHRHTTCFSLVSVLVRSLFFFPVSIRICARADKSYHPHARTLNPSVFRDLSLFFVWSVTDAFCCARGVVFVSCAIRWRSNRQQQQLVE